MFCAHSRGSVQIDVPSVGSSSSIPGGFSASSRATGATVVAATATIRRRPRPDCRTIPHVARRERDAAHREPAAERVVPLATALPRTGRRRGGEHEMRPRARVLRRTPAARDERDEGHREPDGPVPRLALRRERRVAARARLGRLVVADELPAVPVDAMEDALGGQHEQRKGRERRPKAPPRRLTATPTIATTAAATR